MYTPKDACLRLERVREGGAQDHVEGLTEAKFLYITGLEGRREGVKAPQPQAMVRTRMAEAQQ